jgi:hypothetical protein
MICTVIKPHYVSIPCFHFNCAQCDVPLCLPGFVPACMSRFHPSLPSAAGDDTEVEPVGWPHQVLEAFAAQPSLMLMLLNDSSDPGFPSFPVLRVDRHLELFGGQLLPECFINQGKSALLDAYGPQRLTCNTFTVQRTVKLSRLSQHACCPGHDVGAN